MSRILRVVCVIVIVAMTYAHFSDALAICTIDHQCYDGTYDETPNPPITLNQIRLVNNRLFTMIYDSIERGDYFVASLVLPQIGDPRMRDTQRIMAMNKWKDVSYPNREYQSFSTPYIDPIRIKMSSEIMGKTMVEVDREVWNILPLDPTHRISVAGTITDAHGEQSCFAYTLTPGLRAIFREEIGSIRTGMITLSHIHIPPLMAENCLYHPDCFFYIPDAVGAFTSTRGADVERRFEMHQFMLRSQLWRRRITMEQIRTGVDVLHNMTDVRHEMIPSLRNRIETCFVDFGGPSH